MKRIGFNELIEKAFSMGYEYAQKEFGAVKRENKKKKREWERKLGEEFSKSKSTHDAAENIARSIYNNRFNKVLKDDPLSAIKYIGGPSKEEIDSIKDSDVNINMGRRKIRWSDRSSGNFYHRTSDYSLNDIINSRQKTKKESNHKIEDFNKDALKHYKDSKDNEYLRDNFYLKNRMNREDAKKRSENNKKNLKKAALISAGVATAGVAAYAGKKAYDKYKAKKQKEQKDKENKNK